MNDRVTASAQLVLDDGVVWPEDAVEVGRVVDAWGVKGGLKVMPFSSDPQALFCTKKWFLRPAEQAPGALARPSAATSASKSTVPSAATSAATASKRAGAAHSQSGKGVSVVSRFAKPRFLQVISAREQGDIIVVTAEGLADRNDAEALRGATVFVSRSAFPTPDEDEFYWVDLIGLDVVNREGQALGRVVDLMDTGPTCVLRCVDEAAAADDRAGASATATGADQTEPTERLIPFVSAYIVSVSLADKRIVADWGLDY